MAVVSVVSSAAEPNLRHSDFPPFTTECLVASEQLGQVRCGPFQHDLSVFKLSIPGSCAHAYLCRQSRILPTAWAGAAHMPGKKGRSSERELPTSEAAPPAAGAPSSDVVLRRSTRFTRSGGRARPEPEGDSEHEKDDDATSSEEEDEDGFRRKKTKTSRKRRREPPSKARSSVRDDAVGGRDENEGNAEQHKRSASRGPAVVYIPREGRPRQPLTAEHEDEILGALKRGDWSSERLRGRGHGLARPCRLFPLTSPCPALRHQIPMASGRGWHAISWLPGRRWRAAWARSTSTSRLACAGEAA